MEHVQSSAGISVSYDRYGSGPPLVLVHGSFSDHATNWEFVKPLLETRFAVYAVARRGRGETAATEGHTLLEEARDVAAVIRSIPEPVFLLGHSYGAHAALLAAAEVPDRVRKLVLYEPPWPGTLTPEAISRLEALAARGEWDEMAYTFFRDTLLVPLEELDELRASEHWPPIVQDARASLGDLRALHRYEFIPERFWELPVPVLFQIGELSPRDLYATDALVSILPDVTIEWLPGQAHEAMTTAPELYAEAVTRFLLE